MTLKIMGLIFFFLLGKTTSKFSGIENPPPLPTNILPAAFKDLLTFIKPKSNALPYIKLFTINSHYNPMKYVLLHFLLYG